MRFMLLVKSDPSTEAGVTPDAAAFAARQRFKDEMRKANVLLAAEGLKESAKGSRVRCNKATKKLTVLDGPFTESRELVAAFWLIQTTSKDEAIAWAKRAPFQEGEVEVRQIFEVDDFPPDPDQARTEEWRRKKVMRETMSAEPSRGNKKMRFAGFVKGGADSESGQLPKSDALEKMGVFVEQAAKAGVFLGGDGLKPTSAGSKVRYQGSNRTVIDGPFTEAKEIIAGYSILATNSKEEAVEWTKRFVTVDAEIRGIPEVECELREIVEAEGLPS